MNLREVKADTLHTFDIFKWNNTVLKRLARKIQGLITENGSHRNKVYL